MAKKKAQQPSADEEKATYVLVFLGIVVFLFLTIVVIFKYVSGPTTLNELHQENLEKMRDTDTAYVYKGFSFIKKDGLWHTQVEDHATGRVYNVPLHYGPREVEGVLVMGNFSEFWKRTVNNTISKYKRQTYVTYNLGQEDQLSSLALAAGELSINLAEAYGMAAIPACINKNSSVCKKIPTITCTTTTEPVIYLSVEDSLPVVATRENCLVIQGKGEELVRSVDRFLYLLYEIME